MESVRGPRNVALAPGVGAGTWIVTPMPNDFFAYLNGWSRHPKAVGGPFPSSPWTARRLAQAALDMAIPKGGPVLELGAGTGPVTEALIEAGRSVAEIIAVEQDAALCQTLERRFRGLRVVHGNALEIGKVLASARVSRVSVVVCGLPMRAIASPAATRCYAEAFRLMPSGGAIIQYTYGFKAPVDLDGAATQLDAQFIGREWRNVPPMGIWSYRLARSTTWHDIDVFGGAAVRKVREGADVDLGLHAQVDQIRPNR